MAAVTVDVTPSMAAALSAIAFSIPAVAVPSSIIDWKTSTINLPTSSRKYVTILPISCNDFCDKSCPNDAISFNKFCDASQQ